ncbi:MAG: UDP-3-O-(3-hydroxymyristoyl)glucosamine N-acyltransferase [Candidatus Omnitrophica bacterium]|nr:UDP-3-O-(3-hydroxymyristoyl)glucosamine N-acyltransferase [Candidatus Omnitrophota bacterium]
MKLTLKEIAELIEGQIVGDSGIVITGVAGIKEAKEGDITFLANPKYLPLLKVTGASAIIVNKDIEKISKPIIKTANPSLAFSKLANIFYPQDIIHPKGIHPTAIISSTAHLDKNVAVGAYTIIEDEVYIGENTIIYGNCYIGVKTKIGSNCLIYPNVTIRERIEIKNNVIIHSGTVIGSDGFGFVSVDGVYQKIPQIGSVLIEDDVEIGACVTIDRARFDKTIIGKGTKVDNLVQIAHNVVIGENCIIVAQAGISGSTTLGNRVILAGQVGLVGHINIGDDVVVMAKSGVSKDIPNNTKVFGYPAREHNEAKRILGFINRLPHLYKKISELEKKIKELEEQIKKPKNMQNE